jgi:hypothetical protein
MSVQAVQAVQKVQAVSIKSGELYLQLLCPRWNFSHSSRINFVMFAEGMACLNGN